MAEHAHPRLTLNGFPGCRVEGGTKRLLVERSPVGNCSLDGFFLEPDPAAPGRGSCPNHYDVVIRWVVSPDGVQEPVRFEVRGGELYDTGRALVSVRPFECSSPTQVRDVWITEPGLRIA